MIGMGSIITKDVPPFIKGMGSPFRYRGINAIGMSRNGFDAAQIREVETWAESGVEPQNRRIREVFDAFWQRSRETQRPVLSCVRLKNITGPATLGS